MAAEVQQEGAHVPATGVSSCPGDSAWIAFLVSSCLGNSGVVERQQCLQQLNGDGLQQQTTAVAVCMRSGAAAAGARPLRVQRVAFSAAAGGPQPLDGAAEDAFGHATARLGDGQATEGCLLGQLQRNAAQAASQAEPTLAQMPSQAEHTPAQTPGQAEHPPARMQQNDPQSAGAEHKPGTTSASSKFCQPLTCIQQVRADTRPLTDSCPQGSEQLCAQKGACLHLDVQQRMVRSSSSPLWGVLSPTRLGKGGRVLGASRGAVCSRAAVGHGGRQCLRHQNLGLDWGFQGLLSVADSLQGAAW